MPRLAELSDAEAATEVTAIFDNARATIGMVPNVYRSMAQSPAVLTAFVGMLAAMQAGTLSRALQQQIAVRVAQVDRSTYCLAVNVAMGLHVGLDEGTITAARTGQATDSRVAAALQFVSAMLAHRGQIDDADFAVLSEAGFTSAEIAEIIGNVGLNLFANYFNLAAGTTPDFPVVALD